MSRREALTHMKKMQVIGLYSNFEKLPVRKVYFAVVYNNYGSDKESIKRLLKGEKFIGEQEKEVKMIHGYGKLLGIIKVPATERTKAFSQYIIYDVNLLVGKAKKYEFNVYNEAWIKLGEWVNKTYPRLDKERVVFT